MSPPRADEVVAGEDGLARCPWSLDHPLNTHYHDTEWGVPVRSERGLFERLTLEAFQSGLSWLTILRKREAFRAAFAGFDVDAVAAFTDEDHARLMTDAAIVRNRAKIAAAITNARAIAALREAGGIADLIWAHQPAPAPALARLSEVPPKDAASAALAKDLKRTGLVFAGPTTCMALMEAAGLVDHHLEGCHRRGVAGGG
ncbi:MAG: DNA-3-methyladenine glycosylase I [Miltoncostaeaceae bacterium]